MQLWYIRLAFVSSNYLAFPVATLSVKSDKGVVGLTALNLAKQFYNTGNGQRKRSSGKMSYGG